MDIEAVVADRIRGRELRVPPSPVVALRLLQVLDDPESAMASVVGALEKDQGLAALVLRLSNSVKYRRSGEVTTLAQAVARVGRSVLREVAVARELHDRTLGRGPLVALRRRAWRDALTSAQVAGHIAPWFGVKREEAWIAGLLHDIGRVPAIGLLEDVLTEHPDADTRTEEGWWALVESHHVALGMRLADAWKLPAMVASAIESHHRDYEQGPLLEVLRAADQVVRMLEGRGFVPADHLGAIATLSTEQCESLAEFLPTLPAVLDAFREPALDQPASAISYELQLVEDSVSGREVTVTSDGLKYEARVLAATEETLLLRAFLPVGQIVSLSSGPMHFSARVSAIQGDAVEVRSWALDVAQAHAWADFVVTARAAA